VLFLTPLQFVHLFCNLEVNAIPKHAGPEAKSSNPTTRLTLLWGRNLLRGNFNQWQVSWKEAEQRGFSVWQLGTNRKNISGVRLTDRQLWEQRLTGVWIRESLSNLSVHHISPVFNTLQIFFSEVLTCCWRTVRSKSHPVYLLIRSLLGSQKMTLCKTQSRYYLYERLVSCGKKAVVAYFKMVLQSQHYFG